MQTLEVYMRFSYAALTD